VAKSSKGFVLPYASAKASSGAVLFH